MRKLIFLWITLGYIPTYSTAQYYFYNEDYLQSTITWQIGFSVGGMNCLTDLGGKKGIGSKFIKDINWNTTRAGGSIYASANYLDRIGARLELAFGQVKASDQVLKNDRTEAYARFIRHQNFRSNIREVAFLIECYPFSFINWKTETFPLIIPYVVAGIGYFNFNPETYYKNTWINVSRLNTEGQGFAEYPTRKVYRLNQFNLPAGLGLKFEASPVLLFQLELHYRKLWTDYLDDVSKTYIDPALFEHYFTGTRAALAAKLADRREKNDNSSGGGAGDIRGNYKNNDAYFSGMLKIGLVLGRQRR